MTELVTFGPDDLREAGDAIRSIAREATSMEDAANRVVEYLYDALRDGDASGCVLVRMYKTHRFGDLPAPLQSFAQAVAGDDLDEDVRCLTLLATRGTQPEWNDRAASRGHQAIPLVSRQLVEELPMISGLILQLGLDLETVIDPGARSESLVELSQASYDVFHVADAPGSMLLPAQAEFVVPYGVRSAVGFGGMLYTGDFFAVVLFSSVAISQPVAKTLKVLSLAVRVTLLPFVKRVFAES